jgi:hypothetical protein
MCFSPCGPVHVCPSVPILEVSLNLHDQCSYGGSQRAKSRIIFFYGSFNLDGRGSLFLPDTQPTWPEVIDRTRVLSTCITGVIVPTVYSTYTTGGHSSYGGVNMHDRGHCSYGVLNLHGRGSFIVWGCCQPAWPGSLFLRYTQPT